MVEMAKANGVNVYHYLTYLLEKMPTDKTGDEELELLAPWNENDKAEIQRRANNTNQLNVNCQGTPATENQPVDFLLWLNFKRLQKEYKLYLPDKKLLQKKLKEWLDEEQN